MDPAEFRRLGHELVDWVADYREHIAELPVMSRVAPGEIQSLLPGEPPQEALGLDDITAELDRVVLPGITHWNHPGWFAYFPSNTDLSSVLADMVSAGLGAQCMSWQTSPAGTRSRTWSWSGCARCSACRSSSLVSSTTARARPRYVRCSALASARTAFRRTMAACRPTRRRSSSTRPTRVTAPSPKPRCWPGSAPTTCACWPPTTTMRCASICSRRPCATTSPAGRRPCAVVATVGTTATTALDPVARIADVAQRHGLWLHLDAALAGTAMICPELRWMWEGVEHADSLVLNPHKWMGTGFDLSAYYVRDPEQPDPGDEHRPELPAHGPGRPGAQPARLGHPPGAPVPRPQTLVLAP